MEPCCQDPANLVVLPADPARPDVLVRQCTVCQRRHFELSVEPGSIHLRGV